MHLGLLAEEGVANLFGGLPKGKHVLQLDALAVHYRGIILVGSSGGQPSDMAVTLKAIIDNDIDAGNYVAAVGPLDRISDSNAGMTIESGLVPSIVGG